MDRLTAAGSDKFRRVDCHQSLKSQWVDFVVPAEKSR